MLRRIIERLRERIAGWLEGHEMLDDEGNKCVLAPNTAYRVKVPIQIETDLSVSGGWHNDWLVGRQ